MCSCAVIQTPGSCPGHVLDGGWASGICTACLTWSGMNWVGLCTFIRGAVLLCATFWRM